MQVHVLNPLCLPKMDLLAFLYSKEDPPSLPELEKLVVNFIVRIYSQNDFFSAVCFICRFVDDNDHDNDRADARY